MPDDASPSAGAVRSWALASATLAPIALMGGWTVAAVRQPAGYSSVRDTISALAAHGAHDRYIMTTGLFALGACHVVTAAGLRPAGRNGRIAQAAGGAATIAVASFPQPETGSAAAHTTSAAIAFIALSVWPALAARAGSRTLLSRRASATATVFLLALLGWFGITLGGDQVGLSERVLAGAQAVWPLAVVLSVLRSRRDSRITA